LELDLHVESLQADLGLCTLDVSSSCFIVAGAVSIVLSLHSPPPTLKVYAVKAYVDQKVELQSFRDPAKTATLEPKGMLLDEGWRGPYTAKAVQQLRLAGKEEKEILFDASLSEGGWTLEKAARLVSDPADQGKPSIRARR
jgi:hypothetical protein